MSNWLKLEGDVCAVTGALGGMGVEICREHLRDKLWELYGFALKEQFGRGDA